MRRWFASVLLLLTALLPLQPLIAGAQAESTLPACCRRSGAHHCMLLPGMTVGDSATQASVRPSSCPMWKLAVNPAVVAATGITPALLSRPAFAEGVISLGPSFFHVRLAQSRSARAPPASPFSISRSQV
jgi:hypothetical protein